jgi:hypothetical protein
MNRFTKWAAAAALATVCAASQATLLDARFSGNVQTQQNTAFSVGSAVSGEFVYDTTLTRFVSFMIGGQSVAPGFASTASVTPDLFEALYRAQVSPVGIGGTSNSTFTLDLESITGFPSTDAIALLTNAAQLDSNLELGANADFPSMFGFFDADSDGTNIRSLEATLSAVQVAVIPEPEALGLFGIGAVALVGLRSRRRS